METIELKGYGRVNVGKYKLQDYAIEIADQEGKGVKYARISKDGSVLANSIVVGSKSVNIVPIYPVLYPKRITDFVLVEFENRIDIAPGTETNFYVYIPVDIAVYAYRGRSFTIVDIIPGYNPKYTLYGSPDEGVVARYMRTSTYDKQPKPEIGKAISLVRVRNKTREWVTLTKILVHSANLKLYYEEGSWKACVQKLDVTIDSNSTASVTYGEAFCKGLKLIDDPPQLRPSKMMYKTSMLWGI